jgi:hypothetical protein
LTCSYSALKAVYITKRELYEFSARKGEQFRIKSNQGKLVWLPKSCFTFKRIPDIVSIKIDEKIGDIKNSCVTVTIEFDTGEKRWTNFMTVEWLGNLLNEHRQYITGENPVILNKIDKVSVEQSVYDLDSKNELVKQTKEY